MKYVAGLDLGQSSDWTALIICRRSGGIVRERKYEVAFARRWKSMAYPTVIEQIADILSREPFAASVKLNVDKTGLGAPIWDLLEEARYLGKLKCEINGIVFSAANEPTPKSVPKKDLIDNVGVLLSRQRITFARDLALGPAIKNELKNYGFKLGAGGRPTFGGTGGSHDDLTVALALACYEVRPWLAVTAYFDPDRDFEFHEEMDPEDAIELSEHLESMGMPEA